MSFRRYSPLSLRVVEKTTKSRAYIFGPFFGRYDVNFYSSLLAQLISPAVWRSLVEFRLRNLASGNEAECRIYGGWIKKLVLLFGDCGPKFMKFCSNIGTLCSLHRHFRLALYRISFGRYSPLNLPLTCEVVEKRRQQVVVGPGFYREGIPQILDIYFQTALTCGGFGLVSFSELGGHLAKKDRTSKI